MGEEEAENILENEEEGLEELGDIVPGIIDQTSSVINEGDEREESMENLPENSNDNLSITNNLDVMEEDEKETLWPQNDSEESILELTPQQGPIETETIVVTYPSIGGQYTPNYQNSWCNIYPFSFCKYWTEDLNTNQL